MAPMSRLLLERQQKIYNRTEKLVFKPKAQVDMLRRLCLLHKWDFPFEIPEIPEHLSVASDSESTEIILLDFCLPGLGDMSPTERTFKCLWKAIIAPDGYPKDHFPEWFQFDKRHLEMLSDCEPGARWVLFDPNANATYDTITSLKKLEAENPASYQVLIAALFFPNWVMSTAAGSINPQPVMAGCRLSGGNGRYYDSPILHLCVDGGTDSELKPKKPMLKLTTYMTSNFIRYLSFPTVKPI